MTPRPLTDEQLSAALRAQLPVPAASLRERILVEVAATPQQRRLPSILGRLTDADQGSRRRALLLVALVALALVASAVATAGALLQERRVPRLAVDPPAELPGVGEVVHGWPSTGENAAGVYSMDGSTCSSSYCTVGWMHNGYGSGDVEIRVNLDARRPAAAGATPVTIGGHEGTYRRVGGQEEWFIDMDGATIRVLLEAKSGASDSDLAEAHAIVESIRSEPHPGRLGFRVLFRLSSGDWDSG
jgi:hypothetical protein